jgi:hypothetical protein
MLLEHAVEVVGRDHGCVEVENRTETVPLEECIGSGAILRPDSNVYGRLGEGLD